MRTKSDPRNLSHPIAASSSLKMSQATSQQPSLVKETRSCGLRTGVWIFKDALHLQEVLPATLVQVKSFQTGSTMF